MNPFQAALDGFSPSLYLATLTEVAKSDGLQAVEIELLGQHAQNFGLDLDSLPQVPADLRDVPWSTRVLVYRDALTLALADSEDLTTQEVAALGVLAERMGLPAATAAALKQWVVDHAGLLDRLSGLLECPPR